MQESDRSRPGSGMRLAVVSLFLFWPFSIPAILTASKVDPLWRRGDSAGAAAAAAESRKWSRLAIVTGLVWWGALAVCCAFGGFAAIFGRGGAA